MQDAIKIIQDALDSNRTLKDIFPLIEKICVDVMEKKFNSATYMCPGLIYSYGPVVSRCDDKYCLILFGTLNWIRLGGLRCLLGFLSIREKIRGQMELILIWGGT